MAYSSYYKKKIKVGLRDFGLEDYNPIISLINSYIFPPSLEYQTKNAN